MIPHQQHNEVHRSGVEEGEKFKLVMNAHMAGLLSDKMYKDKPAAVIRELACNAQDSHIDAGNPDPISIHLPTSLEPWFTVQDWGVGLSDEEVHTLFTTYGASSKRDSNKVVGQFGIGSKVGFAYTDQFTVTSIHDGVSRTYSCYKDPDGMPRITPLTKAKKTEDGNGVAIQVPVKPDDIQAFTTKAAQQLSLFKPLPKTNTELEFRFLDDDILQQGKDWVLYKREQQTAFNSYASRHGKRENIYAAMGNVSYPVDTEQLDYDSYSWASGGLILLQVKIGDLDVAASREELSYNDITIKALEGMLMRVRDESAEALKGEFSKYPTDWEKRLYFKDLTDSHPLRTLIREHYKDFNGFKVDEKWGADNDMMEPFTNFSFYEVERNKGNLHFIYGPRCPISNEEKYVYYVEGKDTNITARLKVWVFQQGLTKTNTPGTISIWDRERVILAKVPSEAHMVKLMKKMGNPPSGTFTPLSSITDQDIEDWATGKGLAFNPKTAKTSTLRRRPAKTMLFDHHYHRGYGGSVEDKRSWKKVGITVDTASEPEGVYLRLKDYRIDHPALKHYTIQDVLKVWVSMGLIPNQERVIGVFSSFKDPFADAHGWVDLSQRWDDWCLKNLSGGSVTKKLITNHVQPQVSSILTYQNMEIFRGLTTFIDHGIIKIENNIEYRRWYYSLINYSTNRDVSWSKLLNKDSRYYHVKVKVDQYYRPQRNSEGKPIPCRHGRMIRWHKENYEKWVRSYPLIPPHLNSGDDQNRDHMKLYMEKINEG